MDIQSIRNYQQESKLLAREQGLTEFVPSHAIVLDKIVTHAMKKGHIPPPPARVLDLGSGDGSAMGVFACHGYETFGIDVNPTLVSRANAFAKTMCVEGVVPPRFAAGNYLPIELRSAFWPVPHLLLGGDDGFSALGMPAQAIDLFYAFIRISQSASLKRFFSSCARKGAKLLSYTNPITSLDFGVEVCAFDEILVECERIAFRGIYQVLEKK